MDYFMINKYSSIDENILYIARNIMDILSQGDKTFGKLVDEYQSKYTESVSLNVEIKIYMALSFLFVTNKVAFDNKRLRLEVKQSDI